MLSMSAYGEKVVGYLQFRNGLKYEVKQEEPFTGKFISKWSNVQKQSEVNFKNGKQDGLATMWHENGQKKEEINYINGKEDGLTTYWYENGQKQSEVNFKNGKQDGLATIWYENGKYRAILKDMQRYLQTQDKLLYYLNLKMDSIGIYLKME